MLISSPQIESTVLLLKSDLEKRMALLSESAMLQGKTAIGLAMGLGVIVQIYPYLPLYYSAAVLDDVWNLALLHLQLSGKSDIRVSQAQVQVAWILVGSLMSSGPQFVKRHLNKLLLLWQNALPRPLSRDSMAGRPINEIQYLLHLKDRVLAAINLFLHYNENLVTLDLSRRIMAMLVDTSAFVARIPAFATHDDVRILPAHLQLTESLYKVKAHILRCYTTLIQCDKRNTVGPEILMMAISTFTENDSSLATLSTGGKITSSISSESWFASEDNFPMGISGYYRKFAIPGSTVSNGSRHWSIRDSDSDMLEDTVNPLNFADSPSSFRNW
jgi:HEAT repeat-containing protein 5